MKEETVYSTDNERFETADDILCNIEDFEIGSKITIHKGVSVPANHSQFICPEHIIEGICEQAYEKFSDYSEDYLEGIQSSETLDGLKDVISKWLSDNAGEPTFYGVRDVTKHEIIVSENIELP